MGQINVIVVSPRHLSLIPWLIRSISTLLSSDFRNERRPSKVVHFHRWREPNGLGSKNEPSRIFSISL